MGQSQRAGMQAKDSGADAVFVKKEWLAEALKGAQAGTASQKEGSGAVLPDHILAEFVQDLQYRLSGDD